MERDPVWYDDVSILFKRWSQFFPRASMSASERTNASVRLIVYVTVALYLYNRDGRGLLLGFVAAAIVSILHPRHGIDSIDSYTDPSVVSVPCKKSTPENPFGNFLLTDNPDDPPGCDSETQQDLIRENFNRNLYRNTEDLWERQNSQRQFYTMPTAKVPDTKAFGEFLSGGFSRPGCKEDPSVCTGYN